MGVASRKLKGLVTYWEPTGAQNDYGVQTFSGPVVLHGRWQDNNVLIRRPDGEQVNAKAVIWVESDVLIGGFLAQEDQTAHADPTTLAGALEIMNVVKTPDMRQLSEEIRAYV